jgi:hypothetical protein
MSCELLSSGRHLSNWLFRRIPVDATEVTGPLDGSWSIVVDRIKCWIPPLVLVLGVET